MTWHTQRAQLRRPVRARTSWYPRPPSMTNMIFEDCLISSAHSGSSCSRRYLAEPEYLARLSAAGGAAAGVSAAAGVASGVSAEACDLGPASRPMCQSDKSESRCETSTMNVTVVETSTTRRTSPAISLVEPR